MGYVGITVKGLEYGISRVGQDQAQTLSNGSDPSRLAYHTLVVVQRGNRARIYLNGQLLKMGEISILPKDLGNTLCNYLGRSPLDGKYQTSTYISDVRLYDGALSIADVAELSGIALEQEDTLK